MKNSQRPVHFLLSSEHPFLRHFLRLFLWRRFGGLREIRQRSGLHLPGYSGDMPGDIHGTWWSKSTARTHPYATNDRGRSTTSSTANKTQSFRSHNYDTGETGWRRGEETRRSGHGTAAGTMGLVNGALEEPHSTGRHRQGARKRRLTFCHSISSYRIKNWTLLTDVGYVDA